MGNRTCVPCKANNRHQRWHHSVDRIPFNQHMFSSYVTSIIPKYVDRCTIKILWGAGVMTSSVPLFFYEQLLPLPKPLLLLPLPHPSPLPPNKNFGRRLDFARTLFCINFCSYQRLRDTDERVFCLVNTIKIRPPFYKHTE